MNAGHDEDVRLVEASCATRVLAAPALIQAYTGYRPNRVDLPDGAPCIHELEIPPRFSIDGRFSREAGASVDGR